MGKPLVIIESPFAGDVDRHIEYARRACRDSIMRGESPYLSHLLYTQKGILDDTVTEERSLGMTAGFEWIRVADYSVVYGDYHISEGMRSGIRRALDLDKPVHFRLIGENPIKDEEIIVKSLKKNPGQSVEHLEARTRLRKRSILLALNNLINSGKVSSAREDDEIIYHMVVA